MLAATLHSPSHLIHEHKLGGTRYEACCFPPAAAPGIDQSLAALYSNADAAVHQKLAMHISTIARHKRALELFGPSVATHSAQVVNPEELTTAIHLPHGIILRRNKELPSDGTFLRPRQGFIMSGYGCPIITAEAMGYFLVAHVSRDNLLDRHKIMTRQDSRRFESVIHWTRFAFKQRGIEARDIQIRVYFHIDPSIFSHPFNDPEYGASNARMYEYILEHYGPDIMQEPRGELDLSLLVAGIARRLKMKEVPPADPLPLGFPTTRTPEGKTGRNLVLVVRHT